MSIRNNRVVQSFVAAALAVAIVFAGLTGTANAMPASQGGTTANVVISMPANVGTFDQSPSQSWISLFRMADHKAYTGTVQTAMNATNIGDPGNHTATYRGNREFVANGVEPGDYLIVAHLGTQTLVMNTIRSIAEGNQYPNQSDTFVWMGTGTGATTTKAKTGTTKTTTAVAPTGTAMCLFVTTAPITTTKTAKVTVGDVGDTFVGKMLFVLKGKAMTVEETLAAYAKNPKLGIERDFSGLAPATPVSIGSGNWAVFRIRTADGKRVYMGDLDASPNGSYAKLTRVDGVCEPFDLRLAGAKAATTGTATDILGWLAVASAIIGLVIVNRRRNPGTVSAS